MAACPSCLHASYPGALAGCPSQIATAWVPTAAAAAVAVAGGGGGIGEVA